MFPFKLLGKNKKDKQKREMSPCITSFDSSDTNCGNPHSGLSKKSKQGKDISKKEGGKKLFGKKTAVEKNHNSDTPTNSVNSGTQSEMTFETEKVEGMKPSEFLNKDKLFRKLYEKRRHSVADIPTSVGCKKEEEKKFGKKLFDPFKYRCEVSKKNVKGKIFSKLRDGRRHSVANVTGSVNSKTEQEKKLESKRLDLLKRSENSKKGSNQKLLGNIRDDRRHSVSTIGSGSSVALDNEVMTRERRLLDIAQLDKYIAYLHQHPGNDGLSRLCCAQLLRTFYTRLERNYLSNHSRSQSHRQRSHSAPPRDYPSVQTKEVATKDGGGEDEREDDGEESEEEEGDGDFCDNRCVKDSDCSSSASASMCNDDEDDGDYSDDDSCTSDYEKSPAIKYQNGRRQSVTIAVYPQNFEIF